MKLREATKCLERNSRGGCQKEKEKKIRTSLLLPEILIDCGGGSFVACTLSRDDIGYDKYEEPNVLRQSLNIFFLISQIIDQRVVFED